MPLNVTPSKIAFNVRGDGSFNKPFDAQVEFLRKKLDVPTEHYDDIIQSGQDRAFVVAGATKAGLLADIHTAINEVANKGQGIAWFRKNFYSIVQQYGWEGWTGSDTKKGRDWRTRVIYNTNLSASYAAGRWAQLNDPDLIASRPYWKYIHSDTVAHPRPWHQLWGKTVVLKHDDPWWKTHFPPNGWGCQCRIKAVSAKEYGGQVAPDDGTYTKRDRYGNEHTMPMGIDYGWDYAPGASLTPKAMAKNAMQSFKEVDKSTFKPLTNKDYTHYPVSDSLPTGQVYSAIAPLVAGSSAVLSTGGAFNYPVLVDAEAITSTVAKSSASYLPYIKDVIEHPSEVWSLFSSLGKAVDMRVKSIKRITVDGKSVLLVAQSNNGMLEDFVAVESASDEIANSFRVGVLVYKQD